MHPTLRDKQLKLIVYTKDIKKDDIIIFKYQEYSHIKRVYALEGDLVFCLDNKLFINNVKEKSYSCNQDFKYNILENQMFVLGDNNENSIDSRIYGLISIDSVVGKIL